ncbi:Beta-13-galactosyltransferase sqv-2 [Brugia pahangi]
MASRSFMPARILILFCGCLICIICTITLSLTCICGGQFTSGRPRNLASSDMHKQQGVEGVSDLPSTYLAIVIMSSAGDAVLRTVIRNTWLKLSSKGKTTFRYAFPIGTENLSLIFKERLKEENNLFNDLIFLEDLTDTYQNLTKKSLLSMQAIHNMYKFEFLLKVDSDSFVRLGAFLKALKDIADPNLYWGFLDGRARPKRRGQWAERDWILCDRYVPYQLGGGYVLSYKLVDFLVRNKDLLKFYKNEDVSVGAWLAGLSVRYVHDPRFDTEFRSRGCNNQYIVTHKQTPESLNKLYASIVNTGKLCEKEYRIHPSYVYDWSVPPSMCCSRQNDSDIP